MSKFILSLIIALLSYVCIAQSGIMDTPTEATVAEVSNQEVAKEEPVEVKEEASVEQESNEESFFRDNSDASNLRARFIEIDQNREARIDMWRGRIDNLLDYMGISQKAKDVLGYKVLGTNLAYLSAGILAIILSVIIQKIIILLKDLFLKGMRKPKRLRAMALYIEDFVIPISKFFILFGVSICVYLNIVNDTLLSVVAKFLAIYFFWLGLSLVMSLSNTFFDLLSEKVKSGTPAASMLIPLARNTVITVAVCIFLIVLMENFGLNVSAILASLGIGGAALAFASKDTIANFFGSVSLIIDSPFVVGDEVMVSQWHGFVESIGFRSTKIRTFHSEVVSIPNSILANEHIKNNSLRTLRRVEMKIGLVYSTSQDELKSAVEAIEVALKATRNVDVITVRFDEFADSSLNISIIYICDITDYVEFMKVKELASFNIMGAVRGLGLSMAFPSRSLYIENESIRVSRGE